MKNQMWYLSQIKLFDKVSSEDMAELDNGIQHTRLRKHTLVQTPDLSRDGLFFVKEGALRLYTLNSDGKQFTTGLLGKGSTFGEVSSFSLGTRGAYIETMDDTLICSINGRQFEDFIASRPEIMKRVMRILSDNLNDKIQFLEKLALGTVKDKILFLLLHLCREFGLWEDGLYRIDFPLTHQEIGNMIGVTRESVSSTLTELAKEGIVRSTSRRSISIDPQLARQACCY